MTISQSDQWERAKVDVEVVHTHCGIALPRVAHRRTGAQRAGGHALPRTVVEYRTRSFTARSQREHETLESAFRLRADVLIHELGWLLPDGRGVEQDRCDAAATHFAVLAHLPNTATPTVAGYARVLLPQHGFMLWREFADLLGDASFLFDKTQAFEVSRMVVHPHYRGLRCREGRTVTEHLGRAIAIWALAHRRTECYTVCETRHIRALRLRGMRFERFGHEVEYQRGVQVCAAVLRLAPTLDAWRERRPTDLAWYLGTQSRSTGRWMPR